MEELPFGRRDRLITVVDDLNMPIQVSFFPLPSQAFPVAMKETSGVEALMAAAIAKSGGLLTNWLLTAATVYDPQWDDFSLPVLGHRRFELIARTRTLRFPALTHQIVKDTPSTNPSDVLGAPSQVRMFLAL